jgi:hypothetical protein
MRNIALNIIFILLSISLFFIIKLKNIFKMKIIKLNIILSIIFSMMYTIIYLIYSFIELYIYGVKNIEYMDSMDIIVDDYKIFDLETIVSVLIRNGYLFIFSVIILIIIFFMIELGFVLYKKEKLRITGL